MSTRAKRAAGLLPMYERQASKYYDKHEESGLHENIKDGYIGSTSKLDGMGELVDTLHNEDGGFYGEDNGEKTYIYKKAKQQEAPAQQAAPAASKPEAAAEPAQPKTPISLSPEVAQAKERVAAYKMDGNAGSTFSTESSAPAEAATAGTNGISFEPGKIDTQAYNPNAGNEEEAQGFADKYKLNLINKGAGQSDFSAV
tara:strand:+ start:293 stop:889 length:597 start_codon:yes stop_codon:yes gene_type:complete